MPDAHTLVQRFFQKKEKKTQDETKVIPHNSFRALFDLHEENAGETASLKHALEEAMLEDGTSDGVHHDITQLLQLSSELKAIGKQAVLLVGERVLNAKTILKRYGKGKVAFSAWLDVTFVSRKTAYNALSYYEFYHALPNETFRSTFKKMPLKASYILASRTGDLKTKLQLIDNYGNEQQEEIVRKIQAQLPLKSEDSRAQGNVADTFIAQLQKYVGLLEKERVKLTLDQKVRIESIINTLKTIQ